ncbi:uncharacterized protein LOC136767799 isoform X1 [Amia ocellicauda]|uniref:uncharacterized protein LOC136767799 isoform X1 n=1 Tax=Amia ocellicauda TaxID=2972642 RepID=UPI0034646374
MTSVCRNPSTSVCSSSAQIRGGVCASVQTEGNSNSEQLRAAVTPLQPTLFNILTYICFCLRWTKMSVSAALSGRLSSALAELMRAALCEIWKAVEETVSESRVEITRRQRENEALRRRLQELMVAGEAAVCHWSSGADGPPVQSRGAGRREGEARAAGAGAVEASALPDSGERAPIEQQHWEQEWDSSLMQDTELTDTEDNQGLTEQHRSRLSEEELRGLESGHMTEPHTGDLTLGLGAVRSGTAGSKFTLKLIKSDPDLDSPHTANLSRIQQLGSECGPSAAGAELGSTRTQSGPSLVSDHIKTEDDTLDSVYTVEPKTQTLFSETYRNLKTDNITDSACELRSELPVGVQCNLGSAALRVGLSGGTDSAVRGEIRSSQSRQLHPRLPRPPSSYSSPSSPTSLWRSHHQPHCGKSFTGTSELIRHHLIHAEKRPYCCTQCGKGFSYICRLKIHQRTHTGERPYCCSHCEKRFNVVSDLNRHQRIHTGEKPYSCTQCGRCFSDVGNLRKHEGHHMRARMGKK